MHPNSSLLAFAGSALCFGLRVSSLSSSCIGVASRSGTEIGGASTAKPCCPGIRAQRCSVRVFRRRTWQPKHSSVFLQLCRIWVLHTCREGLSSRAWQHRLTTWTKHEPIALLRCFTNAHDGKTDTCLIVSDLKLATISQTKT